MGVKVYGHSNGYRREVYAGYDPLYGAFQICKIRR